MHSSSIISALISSREFFFPSSASNLALISNGVKKLAAFGFEGLEGDEKYRDGFGELQESFLNSDGFMLALSSSLGDFKIFSGL